MHCKDYMLTTPVKISKDAPISEAIVLILKHRQQHIYVVDTDGRFVGELDAHEFAKVLAPATVGPNYGMESEISSSASAAESYEQVEERLSKQVARPVKDFMDDDLPVVHPEMAIADVIMLLRGGTERMPVVDADGKLVGGISMISILERFHN